MKQINGSDKAIMFITQLLFGYTIKPMRVPFKINVCMCVSDARPEVEGIAIII